MRRSAVGLATVLMLAACAAPTGGAGDASSDVPSDPGAAAPAPTPEVCTPPDPPVVPAGAIRDLTAGRGPSPAGLGRVGDVEVLDLGGGDVATLVALLAAGLDPCADAEPVATAGGLGALVVAGALAAAEGRPLVPLAATTAPADAVAEAAAATAALLARWSVDRVLVVTEDDVPAWAAVIAAATADAVPLVLPAAPVDPAVDPAGDALARLPAGTALTVVASDAARAAALVARLVAAGRPEPAVRIAPAPDAPPTRRDDTPGGTLWLVAPTDPVRVVVAAAAAGARGEPLLAADPDDSAEVLRHAASLRRAGPGRLLLVGAGGRSPAAVDATVAWHLDVALHTEPLPWGGWLPLEGTRIVALYGSPGAPTLGALGQQDLDATFVRAREVAARYETGGLRVVPGFDVIATVATAVAGPQGDYSRRVPIATLRPLVDRARAEGAAVFIDLQPGRTDFLTQAQEYEELLLEPHVFLALDPEWRLRPDQVHLRRIGSVEAAEVQAVADWLAELVRRERLPQKVLMLHQFLLEMLPDRDTIVVPPELVGVVHVDGQGPLATKRRTYRIMAEGADPQWRWGWKQFLRIDTPTVMDPAEVVDRTPTPVVITYQ